jgi:general transcription factor 3C polypeptide 5 (transcription factor C subunit 1)
MSTAASNSQENGDHVSFSLTESETAPWYNVPSKPLVGVEHPFIIKDISKAIESLGNSVNVEKVRDMGKPLRPRP